MNVPQPTFKHRPPRVSLPEITPAVLRFADGHRATAKLKVLSVTGGLLSLCQPVDRGSQVKLMFVTSAGPVLGGAEMLSPVNNALQPFRFLALPYEDQRRLTAIIESSLGSTGEQEWIEKLRLARTKPMRMRFLRDFCRKIRVK